MGQGGSTMRRIGAVGVQDRGGAGGLGSSQGAAAAAAVAAAGAGSAWVRLLLSLVHLEGAWLTLAPLTLRHPLLGYDGLVQLLVRHYTASGLLQVPIALGSLDILGGFSRLVQVRAARQYREHTGSTEIG